MKMKYLIVFITLLFFSCSKDSSTDTKKDRAVADFVSNDDKTSKAPAKITFTNKSKNAHDFIWDFNDGSTSNSNDLIVYHTYWSAGLYLVTLKAIGKPGDTAIDVAMVGIY